LILLVLKKNVLTFLLEIELNDWYKLIHEFVITMIQENKQSGVDFTNILYAAFMHADSKSAKIWLRAWLYLFALLGSACFKAARKMLMKLTHKVEQESDGFLWNCFVWGLKKVIGSFLKQVLMQFGSAKWPHKWSGH